ncbi:EamA family transporter RarD [Silvimonas iriomotensis]|uniref:Membrane protein n=1 Tax=Silvimonas iriomotensis TaxID=449662 RepID=A0ABQ2P446_9NEIS|nr:EamA family transporter RarD [Silvimonas iriomotensis]GGP17936.1 membrane protein [Silvimonas iriomotensis]
MRQGAIQAALAYLIWGLLPLYLKSLHGVAPLEILLCRMVWALFFLVGVLLWRHHWAWLGHAVRQPRLIGIFMLSALLLSTNWFLYIWAVTHNQVIDASLGYFINPLVSVLLGVVFLHERLRAGQWASIGVAAAGVIWLTVQAGHLPWIALGLAGSFGVYGLLRKTAPLGALEGLTLETLVLFPFALFWLTLLASQGQSALLGGSTPLQGLLVLAGPITAIPLLLFAAGARKIPLSLLGLLQYIGPTVQLLLGALLWHEPFSGPRLLGFAVIWLALVLYTAEGFYMARMKKT